MAPAEFGYRLRQAGVGMLEKRIGLDARPAAMIAAPRVPQRRGAPPLAPG